MENLGVPISEPNMVYFREKVPSFEMDDGCGNLHMSTKSGMIKISICSHLFLKHPLFGSCYEQMEKTHETIMRNTLTKYGLVFQQYLLTGRSAGLAWYSMLTHLRLQWDPHRNTLDMKQLDTFTCWWKFIRKHVCILWLCIKTYIKTHYCYILWLVGGWATPLKNMNVTWDDEIPNISGKIKFMLTKPPTRYSYS